jgi:hypothetical protein
MPETVSGAFGELAALLQRSAVAHAAIIERSPSASPRHSATVAPSTSAGTAAAPPMHSTVPPSTSCATRTGNADRPAYAAVALGTDVAMLTAASNDLGFEQAYARQVEALVTKRDLLILHSTSGRSPNLLAAAKVARAKGAEVIALLGRDGGPLKALADIALVVEHDDTGRIQLVHMAAQHVIVGMVEARLAGTA